MKKRVSAVVIVLVCLGGVACIKTLSTSSVGLPQLAFDNMRLWRPVRVVLIGVTG